MRVKKSCVTKCNRNMWVIGREKLSVNRQRALGVGKGARKVLQLAQARANAAQQIRIGSSFFCPSRSNVMAARWKYGIAP